MISGIVTSPGIALGKAFILQQNPIKIGKKFHDSNTDASVEICRFTTACEQTRTQIQLIYHNIKSIIDNDKSAIFDAHLMLLHDEEFKKKIIELIINHQLIAEFAVETFIDEHIKIINKLNNKYLQEKSHDLEDIKNRLLKNMLGIPIIDLSNNVADDTIIVTQDLSPSEAAQLDAKKIHAVITESGSKTSHAAIMLKALDIPTIMNVFQATKVIKTNDLIILDAIDNQIYINPNAQIKNQLVFKKQHYQQEKLETEKLKDLPAITLDGHQVEIYANINSHRDIINIEKYGAEGIGLYRTEYLFMESESLPSEEEQFLVYKEIIEKSKGQSVTIRILDIGGDKTLPYLALPKENNPYLGFRSIRIDLKYSQILSTQLRSILRASAFGQVKIMFPFIISVEEIRYLKNEMNQLKEELRNEGYAFDADIQIGIMIETPAAAMILNHLAKEVDFFSIGTNDLTQYTLAVDRNNETIAHLYNPMTPSVLRLIKHIIDTSHQSGKWISMCGELAGDEQATLLLVGMGLDEFSMNPLSIPRIKKIIRNTNFTDVKMLAEQALAQATAKDLMSVLTQFIKDKTIC